MSKKTKPKKPKKQSKRGTGKTPNQFNLTSDSSFPSDLIQPLSLSQPSPPSPIDIILKECQDGNYIYRGTNKRFSEDEKGKRIEDGISSLLYRNLKEVISENIGITALLKEEERVIISEARRLFAGGTTDIEILTDLRHFGGETNSIDFTRNLYIALFFACHGDIEEDGELILLDATQLTSVNDMKHIYSDQSEPEGSIKMIDPASTPASRQRVEFQSSVFVNSPKGYIAQDRMERIKIGEDTKRLNVSRLGKIIQIEADHKNSILKHLEKFHNISPNTVYNDLIGFISNNQSYPEARKELGTAYNAYHNQDYDLVIESCNKAIVLRPQYTAVYNIRGLAYYERGYQGDRDKAIADYTKALKINPQYVVAYHNLGNAYVDQGDLDKAIEDYTKAIEIDPKYVFAYFCRGLAYTRLGNYEEAIKNFTKAIEINPQYADAYNNRGNTYLLKRHYDAAMADYTKALEINPQYAHAYLGLGFTYTELGQYQEAIQDFNEALEINPQDANAYVGRGAAYARQGNYEEAIADYTKAIEINPQYAHAYVGRGLAYAGQGEYQTAIKNFNEAIEINPQYAHAYYNRGVAYDKLGDKELAKADFITAHQLDSNLKRLIPPKYQD